MNTAAMRTLFVVLCSCALCFGGSESRFDTSQIDSVLERSGTWIEGLYVVLFPRPDLRVELQGVRLSTAHVVSFVTFMGSEDNSEMMGEVCALSSEMTPAIAKLRAGGFTITGAHNHFIGEWRAPSGRHWPLPPLRLAKRLRRRRVPSRIGPGLWNVRSAGRAFI